MNSQSRSFLTGSRVRNILEHHLIFMQEKGILRELKDTWWKAPGEPCERPKADSAEMSMESLGGVFLTLVGGVLVGVAIGLFEFWWDKSQTPYGERVRATHTLPISTI